MIELLEFSIDIPPPSPLTDSLFLMIKSPNTISP